MKKLRFFILKIKIISLNKSDSFCYWQFFEIIHKHLKLLVIFDKFSIIFQKSSTIFQKLLTIFKKMSINSKSYRKIQKFIDNFKNLSTILKVIDNSITQGLHILFLKIIIKLFFWKSHDYFFEKFVATCFVKTINNFISERFVIISRCL